MTARALKGTTLQVLKCFLKPNTRKGAEQESGESRRTVNNAVFRLLASKLLKADTTLEPDGRSQWLRITQEGLDALTASGVNVKALKPRDFNVYSKAKPSASAQSRSEARSLMKQPTWVPPPPPPVRDGALDFKNIESKGMA